MYEKVYGTWDHHTLNGVQHASSVRWCEHKLRTWFVVLQPALRDLGIIVCWGCTEIFRLFLRGASDSTVKTRIWVLWGVFMGGGGCPLRTNNRIRDGGKFRSIGISDRISIAIAWNFGFDSIDRTFWFRFHRNAMRSHPRNYYPTLWGGRNKGPDFLAAPADSQPNAKGWAFKWRIDRSARTRYFDTLPLITIHYYY